MIWNYHSVCMMHWKILNCSRSVDSPDACIYAEIRTRIPDTISWDYNFEPAGSVPVTFTVRVFPVFSSCLHFSQEDGLLSILLRLCLIFSSPWAQSAVLKEAIDDVEWPGSSIQLLLQPQPPLVSFRGEGHGDIQVLTRLIHWSMLYFWRLSICFVVLQIDFQYYANTDLLIAFQCDHRISYRYIHIYRSITFQLSERW